MKKTRVKYQGEFGSSWSIVIIIIGVIRSQMPLGSAKLALEIPACVIYCVSCLLHSVCMLCALVTVSLCRGMQYWLSNCTKSHQVLILQLLTCYFITVILFRFFFLLMISMEIDISSLIFHQRHWYSYFEFEFKKKEIYLLTWEILLLVKYTEKSTWEKFMVSPSKEYFFCILLSTHAHFLMVAIQKYTSVLKSRRNVIQKAARITRI